MPASSLAARATRDRLTPDSLDVRPVVRAWLAYAFKASRTAPIGARPKWLTDLESDLHSGKSVTLERCLRYVVGSQMAGADMSCVIAELGRIVDVEAGIERSEAKVIPLRLAIHQDTRSECSAGPVQEALLDGAPSLCEVNDAIAATERELEATAALLASLRNERHRMLGLRAAA